MTVAELLSRYDDSVAINVAYILGNSPVRIWAVGWNDRPATGAELEELKDGFKADVVVFNPDTVKAQATKEGPKRYPVGIEYVIVNGQVVIDGGENTGALPGRGLRRGRSS